MFGISVQLPVESLSKTQATLIQSILSYELFMNCGVAVRYPVRPTVSVTQNGLVSLVGRGSEDVFPRDLHCMIWRMMENLLDTELPDRSFSENFPQAQQELTRFESSLQSLRREFQHFVSHDLGRQRRKVAAIRVAPSCSIPVVMELNGYKVRVRLVRSRRVGTSFRVYTRWYNGKMNRVSFPAHNIPSLQEMPPFGGIQMYFSGGLHIKGAEDKMAIAPQWQTFADYFHSGRQTVRP